MNFFSLLCVSVIVGFITSTLLVLFFNEKGNPIVLHELNFCDVLIRYIFSALLKHILICRRYISNVDFSEECVILRYETLVVICDSFVLLEEYRRYSPSEILLYAVVSVFRKRT